MKSLRQRKPSAVSESIQAKLNMYALAAGAAGVGALALAPAARAEIVYTPTKQAIGNNGVYNLDLSGDGTVDFLIQQWNFGFWASDNQLLADPAIGNGVLGNRLGAAALSSGASIGPKQNFVGARGYGNGQNMLSVTHFTTGGPSYVHGHWANVRNRYLGLKFQIAGETHYGWARLTVTREAYHFQALLTGYAYETIANTPILAGQTSGEAAASRAPVLPPKTDSLRANNPDSAGKQRFKSLGELALGAQSIPARREP
jgi:hypothetical protein